MTIKGLHAEAVGLLQQLISIPSFSREEDPTASALLGFMQKKGMKANRMLHNVWAVNEHFDQAKPTVLLNSHHDTVKPNSAYTRNPFDPQIADGKLFGLGSNDAGGCLVSLLAAFQYFYARTDLSYNLVFLASAEEEISGKNGIEAALLHLPPIDWAIVGEPTLLDLAVAEKGLMVLDCETIGKAGHAARNEGVNAIYLAMTDIAWFSAYRFEKVSKQLGPVKMTVSQIEAGTQHNVVPASCKFVVDVRLTDVYAHQEVLAIIKANVMATVKERSCRLKPSAISEDHPIVQAGLALGRTAYGSSTCSDQALLACPSLKMGPGDSARSHMADEFIYLHEMEEGIAQYIQMLESVIAR